MLADVPTTLYGCQRLDDNDPTRLARLNEFDPDLHDADALRKRRRWRRLSWGLAAATLVALALFAWLFLTAPLSQALEPRKDNALILLAADGQPVARRGSYQEAPVDAARLPAHVRQAFMAIEDRRFYDHWGVDPRGLLRAVFANVAAGGVRQGGSTITQQLAKNSFLSSDRSYRRKAQEVLIAFWLEAWLTKDEIFSRYLSSVYFGEGAYGITAAARVYFDTTPGRLTVGQAAMLAGLVKAPSRLNPAQDLPAARSRARVVVGAMRDAGYLTASQAQRARLPIYSPGRARIPSGSYFADWALPQARAATEDQFGEVRVRTTLDRAMQRFAEDAIRRTLDGPGTWQGAKEAALIAMRPNGEVVALVGGRDYKLNQFNRATQAMRQPGSSFKLFVYLAALRSGFTLDSQVDDTPDIVIGDWAPRNDEDKYRGPINLRTAFAASSNIAAIRLQQAVGAEAVIDEARRLGVRSYLNPWPSLALGTSPITLMELTGAYAAVAAGRYPVVPVAIARQRQRREPMMDWPEREPMLVLLETVIRNGTGSSARLPITAYGKTGTTQNHRDALFVGFAGDLVVGVWVGNDDNSPMNGVSGRGLPALIWRDFMRAALRKDGVLRAPPVAVRQPPPLDDLGATIDAAAQAIGAATTVIEAARTVIGPPADVPPPPEPEPPQ